MDVALALDVSTSVIGWAVVSLPQAGINVPLVRGHIDLRRNDMGFWSKVDQMESSLDSIVAGLINDHAANIIKVFIEDPVQRFRNGLSSAHTIALLARFNALTSRHIRRLTGVDPLYIDATAARKAIGVPLLSKKKSGGVDQKVQTFEFLAKTVLAGIVWPVNRNGKIQPWCFDEVDATVICWAGNLGLGSSA